MQKSARRMDTVLTAIDGVYEGDAYSTFEVPSIFCDGCSCYIHVRLASVI